jgi:hypothetical protein
MAIKSPNASLSYNDQRILLWVMELDQDYGMAGQTFQSHMYSHWYPLSFQLSPLTVKGRTRTQADYNALIEFIREHQRFVASSSGDSNFSNDLSLLKLVVPSEGINVLGVIKSIKGEQIRFNPAPPYEFQFEVWKDGHEDLAVANISMVVHDGWLDRSENASGSASSNINDNVLIPHGLVE